jgi:hypothetical protein
MYELGGYHLRVECAGVVARVCLNEIEVFSEWAGETHNDRVTLNPYVVEGSNSLELFVTPMTDDQGRLIHSTCKASVLVTRSEADQSARNSQRLAAFLWNPSESPVTPGVLTGVWSRQFSVRPEQAYGRWIWQDSPTKSPGPDDAIELVAVAEILHTDLARRDLNALLVRTELRNHELSRALGMTYEQMVTEQAAMYESWFALPNWGLVPFDPNNLAASPQARGRLVRVTDALGAPPIVGGDETHRFAFGFMAARVDGSWAVVR